MATQHPFRANAAEGRVTIQAGPFSSVSAPPLEIGVPAMRPVDPSVGNVGLPFNPLLGIVGVACEELRFNIMHPPIDSIQMFESLSIKTEHSFRFSISESVCSNKNP